MRIPTDDSLGAAIDGEVDEEIVGYIFWYGGFTGSDMNLFTIVFDIWNDPYDFVGGKVNFSERIRISSVNDSRQ